MANSAEFERIKRSVQMLAETFRVRMSGETVLGWATALEKHIGSRLWKALGSALEGDTMPTLKQLMEQSRPEGYRKPGTYQEPERLTPEQKKRADNAAIISMLWLHYNYPRQWPLTAFDGSLMARLFGGDPTAALEKAKLHYTKATVDRWMDDKTRIPWLAPERSEIQSSNSRPAISPSVFGE